MAHQQDPLGVFSPSQASKAASDARNWTYVIAWLTNKLGVTSISALPPFERNPETLRTLLALASHNEAVDEKRALLFEAEAVALQELKDAEVAKLQQGDHDHLRDDLLFAVEEEMPREGQVALDGMANMAISAGVAFPDPLTLGRNLVEIQREILDTDQMLARVDVLHRHIQEETLKTKELLQQLSGDKHQPPAELAKQNLEAQRRVRALSARLPELQDRIASLAASGHRSHPTIEDVVEAESRYMELLVGKKDLDAKIASFQGLPANLGQARSEVDGLRRQLRDITSRRDAVFEGLVERESPEKPRRR